MCGCVFHRRRQFACGMCGRQRKLLRPCLRWRPNPFRSSNRPHRPQRNQVCRKICSYRYCRTAFVAMKSGNRAVPAQDAISVTPVPTESEQNEIIDKMRRYVSEYLAAPIFTSSSAVSAVRRSVSRTGFRDWAMRLSFRSTARADAIVPASWLTVDARICQQWDGGTHADNAPRAFHKSLYRSLSYPTGRAGPGGPAQDWSPAPQLLHL